MTVYFDNAATCPMTPDVLEHLHAMQSKYYANPSSLHSPGREARKALETARTILAQKINAQTEDLVFTSGATEANNMLFSGFDYDVLITSPSEHASVLEPAKHHSSHIEWLNLDTEGFINLTELDSLLDKHNDKRVLVSLMHGNNEIGTLQDIAAIGSLIREHQNDEIFFHSDCVQTFCKHPIDVEAASLDFISVSAHKLHGPRGLGFLYLSDRVRDCAALLLGGGQERGYRSGTANLAAILAFAFVVETWSEEHNAKLDTLHNKIFESLSKLEGIVINGPQDLTKRVRGSWNFSKINSPLNSEQLLLQLDLRGFALSSGSACSSGKLEASIESSYVLRSIHAEEERARRALRLSLSTLNTLDEIEEFIAALAVI